jgi:hypothetical protein
MLRPVRDPTGVLASHVIMFASHVMASNPIPFDQTHRAGHHPAAFMAAPG